MDQGLGTQEGDQALEIVLNKDGNSVRLIDVAFIVDLICDDQKAWSVP